VTEPPRACVGVGGPLRLEGLVALSGLICSSGGLGPSDSAIPLDFPPPGASEEAGPETTASRSFNSGPICLEV
jgi:hypothetical protein